MQHLRIEHKKIPKTTSNPKQVVENESNKTKDRREGKGRVLALSRNVLRILNSDVYYVESESSDNIYYFVKFKPDVFEWCSCKDNSTRHLKCKHIFAIEFAIKWGTLIDIDKLPKEAKRYPVTTTKPVVVSEPKSYTDDDYSF
jgi:hypothetical protein